MKRYLSIAVIATFVLCAWAVVAGAVPLPADMSGYYKFTMFDGTMYSAKVEMGEGSITVHILPVSDAYIGTIVGDKIYFSTFEGDYTVELTQIDAKTSLVTDRNPKTGVTREFTVLKTTEEEANQIAEQNKAIQMNAACSQNVRRIWTALRTFAQEHNGEYPYSLAELYPKYVSDKRTFVCAARGGEFRDFEMDYEYIPGFRIDSPNPDQEAILIEKTGNHHSPIDFHNVLHLDGHISWPKDGI